MRWLSVLVLVTGCSKLFGIEKIPYAGDAAPADSPPDAPLLPKLQLGSTSFDFGSVVDGKSSFAVAIQVTNVGDATTGALAFTKTGDASVDFTIVDDAGCGGKALESGVGCTFSIVFAPSASGSRQAMLEVSDSMVMASATFQGVGLTPGALDMSPSPADFGMRGVGSADGTRMITLKNTGQAPLSLVSMAMTGDAGAFSFVPNAGCGTSDSLAGGASCMIAVTFTPPLGGSHVAALQVTTDAATGSQSSASLGGTGTSTATVVRQGNGTGSVASSANEIVCGSTCSATFQTPMVTLHGTPDALNALTGWSANCNSTGSSCSVPTDRATIEVDAMFTAYPHVTVAVTGLPGEVVGPNGLDCTNTGGTCSIQIAPNTAFTLVPSATGTSTFGGWGGDCAGSQQTCSLVATGDKSATANFGDDYVINLIPGPGTNPDSITAFISVVSMPQC
ncbi:MAG TPA: choice-of-anchor D domain-containing protein, partial [Kofleriaceae bacterium]|nr:choice-of-anchor D domain-containing protein [Kofleriaceae bacterium]